MSSNPNCVRTYSGYTKEKEEKLTRCYRYGPTCVIWKHGHAEARTQNVHVMLMPIISSCADHRGIVNFRMPSTSPNSPSTKVGCTATFALALSAAAWSILSCWPEDSAKHNKVCASGRNMLVPDTSKVSLAVAAAKCRFMVASRVAASLRRREKHQAGSRPAFLGHVSVCKMSKIGSPM